MQTPGTGIRVLSLRVYASIVSARARANNGRVGITAARPPPPGFANPAARLCGRLPGPPRPASNSLPPVLAAASASTAPWARPQRSPRSGAPNDPPASPPRRPSGRRRRWRAAGAPPWPAPWRRSWPGCHCSPLTTGRSGRGRRAATRTPAPQMMSVVRWTGLVVQRRTPRLVEMHQKVSHSSIRSLAFQQRAYARSERTPAACIRHRALCSRQNDRPATALPRQRTHACVGTRVRALPFVNSLRSALSVRAATPIPPVCTMLRGLLHRRPAPPAWPPGRERAVDRRRPPTSCAAGRRRATAGEALLAA